MVALRTRRGRRALTLVVGLLVWLIVVFFFFQAVTPAASGELLRLGPRGLGVHFAAGPVWDGPASTWRGSRGASTRFVVSAPGNGSDGTTL